MTKEMEGIEKEKERMITKRVDFPEEIAKPLNGKNLVVSSAYEYAWNFKVKYLSDKFIANDIVCDIHLMYEECLLII